MLRASAQGKKQTRLSRKNGKSRFLMSCGKDRKRQEKTGKRFEVRGDAEESSDRELEKFPFRRQTGSLWGFLSD